MFDLRYHVASLAAVFFALVIGILVGVALASHGLGNTERNRLEEDLRRAQNRGDALKAQLDALEQSGVANRAFVDRTYTALMANRLKGKRIAVLFVGSVDADVRSEITSALSDANAGAPLRIRAVKVPIDASKVSKFLAGRPPFLAAYAGDGRLDDLGEALGQEFVAGTETPLWNALQTLILEERIGPSKRPADGVVVVRSVSGQTGVTKRFLKGLYRGLRDVGVPVVGVELTGGDGASIQAFRENGLSTVDDVDVRAGKVALVVLLGGGVRGHFGAKPSAEAPLPEVPPLPTTTTGG